MFYYITVFDLFFVFLVSCGIFELHTHTKTTDAL